MDPLILYRNEGFEYWQNLLATIRDDTVTFMFRLRLREPTERAEAEMGIGATPHGQPVEAEDSDTIAAPREPAAPEGGGRPGRDRSDAPADRQRRSEEGGPQ